VTGQFCLLADLLVWLYRGLSVLSPVLRRRYIHSEG